MLKMVPKMLCRTRFEWRQLVAKLGSSTSTDLNSSCLCFPQRLHRCRWPLRSSGCNISVVPAQQEKHQTRTVTVKERFVRKENSHKKSESEFVKFESKIPILQNFGKSESERKKQISQNTTLAYHILSPWPSQDSQNCGDSWQPQNTSLQSQSSHERGSKLQLKLNGNYSSLREILAPSLRDHNGSLRAVNFSNGACATLREDEVLSFRALLLARCRREAVFGLGFLGFSDSRLTWFRACAKLARTWACAKLVKSLRACDAIQVLEE